MEHEGVPELTKAVGFIANLTARTKLGDFIKQIQTHVDTARQDIASVRVDARRVDTEQVSDTTEAVEYYRYSIQFNPPEDGMWLPKWRKN